VTNDPRPASHRRHPHSRVSPRAIVAIAALAVAALAGTTTGAGEGSPLATRRPHAPARQSTVTAAYATSGILFTSLRDGNAEIYVMHSDGSNPRRLTHHRAHDDFPLWAPDGTRISFLSDRDGNWELYSMRPDGTQVRRLTHTDADEHSPAWSPDGATIAFSTDRDDGDWEVYLMDADGGHQRNLTRHPGWDYSPNWSPDGRRIAFVSERDVNAEIYVMDVDGGNPTRLTNNDRYDGLGSNAWSPDGKRLVYLARIDGHAEVCVMNADGSDQQQLTHGNAPAWMPGSEAPAVNVSAGWSPDNESIVFVSDREGDSDVFVMRPDGSHVRNLTFHPGADYAPAWR
jgi:Tol biopolymer transport system component